MRQVNFFSGIGVKFFLGLILGCLQTPYVSAGAKSSVPFYGKKVVALGLVQGGAIELPDQVMHNFNDDIQASLNTRFTETGRYIIADARPPLTIKSNSDEYQWPASVTPSVTVRLQIQALNFSTGFGGEHMFYGYDERFHTPFNDGSGKYVNEFPLKKEPGSDPTWFGHIFDRKGITPFDSQSGLDLGDGFEINAIYAWMRAKYALYQSELRLRVTLEMATGESQSRLVDVQGLGFFFDVAGAYRGYSGGLSAARRDAMLQSIRQAIEGSFDAIDRAITSVPLMAKIDAILPNGVILLGTGPFSEVPAGLIYESVDSPEVRIQIKTSGSNGSVAAWVAGNRVLLKAGQIVRQVAPVPQPIPSPEIKKSLVPDPQSELEAKILTSRGGYRKNSIQTLPDLPIDSIHLPITSYPLSPEVEKLVPLISMGEASSKLITQQATLPYRIARYFMYDQSYSTLDLGSNLGIDVSPLLGGDWVQQIGLAQAPKMSEAHIPVVAIIDSGMDYNHPLLHDQLWFNPDPTLDYWGTQDPYGWDFTAQDPRPYDDAYHGTQIASVLAQVAPLARIMPLKAFNAYGITSSGALSGAFTYAVDHGAQIIVCAWATPVPSRAIAQGIEYALEHGVIVVGAAGDDGKDLSQVSTYPAHYTQAFDNLISVTGFSDQANFDASSIQIAAPDQLVPVAEPRLGIAAASSTGLSAAMVAGALARIIAAEPASAHYRHWIEALLQDADASPELESKVRRGLRLHIRH